MKKTSFEGKPQQNYSLVIFSLTVRSATIKKQSDVGLGRRYEDRTFDGGTTKH